MERTIGLMSVGATLFAAGAALAQAKADITLAASGKNPSFCMQGDSSFAKKWSVAVAGDQATVSGGNTLTLKKVADSKYETETTLGGGKLIWTVVAGPSLSFTVRSTQGCIWEGRS